MFPPPYFQVPQGPPLPLGDPAVGGLMWVWQWVANDQNEPGLGLCHIMAITCCNVSKWCSALPEVLGRRCPRAGGSPGPLALGAHSGPWCQVPAELQVSEGKGVIVGW